MKELSFKVEGEFITDLAREKLVEEHDLNTAVRLLESALVTDQLSDLEKSGLVFNILRGSMEIRGTYPGDDYGVVETPENGDFLHDALARMGSRLTGLSDENDRLMEQMETLDGILPDEYKRQANSELGETVFPEADDGDVLGLLHRADEDYGWLSPTGEFMPVEFGNHEKFALEYFRERVPLDETPAIMKKYHGKMTDWLVYERNFVLLHNPSFGPPVVTRNETRPLTKAQRDFLFDYFTERGRDGDANAVMEEG